MTAKEHNKIFSILMLVQGGLQILGGVFVVLIYGGIGAAVLTNARRDEDAVMGGFFIALAIVAGALVLVLAAIDLLAGWKMFKEKSVGRTWGIVASIVSLLGFPLGTALGIYGLWFLFGEDGKRLYQSGDSQPNTFQPPPYNWR